jgi:hypothetical protein
LHLIASGVMDGISDAISASARANRRSTMTTTKTTTTTKNCVGSKRFGIEAHEASTDDFPAQPSQPDGLGRMCTIHWREYTSGLRLAAHDRKERESVSPDHDDG